MPDCPTKEWGTREVFKEEIDRFEVVKPGEQLCAVFDGLPIQFSWSLLLWISTTAAIADTEAPSVLAVR